MIPTLFIVLTLVFLLVRVMPGDVAAMMVSESRAVKGDAAQTADAIRKRLGLDKPIHAQFLNYVASVARGDFGESAWSRQPTLSRLLEAYPITLQLAVMTIIISLLIAIPSGIISALKQDSWPDYVVRVFTIMGLSAPNFWIATILIIFPAIWFGFLPPLRYVSFFEDPLLNLKQFLLPSISIGIALAGSVSRLTRSQMLEVLRQDYIRTAWSKGLRQRLIIYRHALKNALIPVVTYSGLQMIALLGGSVIAEQVFALPGIGRLTIGAIFDRDYPQIQTNILAFSFTVVMLNLIVDLTYGWLDPRIRYE